MYLSPFCSEGDTESYRTTQHLVNADFPVELSREFQDVARLTLIIYGIKKYFANL